MAVDVGDGLTAADADGHPALPRERWRGADRARPPGPGLLSVRPRFDRRGQPLPRQEPGPEHDRDDQDTPTISWPNYHSGANGDYQPVFADGPVHELLRTDRTPAAESSGSRPTRTRARCRHAVPVRHRARRRAEARPAAAASTLPSCSTASAAPTAGPWAGRSPSRPSTTSPTTTGTSTAAHRRSSPSRRARRSSPTRPTGDLQGLRSQHRELVASRDELPCTGLDHCGGYRVTPAARLLEGGESTTSSTTFSLASRRNAKGSLPWT